MPGFGRVEVAPCSLAPAKRERAGGEGHSGRAGDGNGSPSPGTRACARLPTSPRKRGEVIVSLSGAIDQVAVSVCLEVNTSEGRERRQTIRRLEIRPEIGPDHERLSSSPISSSQPVLAQELGDAGKTTIVSYQRQLGRQGVRGDQ
jgi:hypothetical protein